ncbi:MAG: SemiSWEET transporter [Nitrospinae bacterium]|nr:SemiSWEET transporter [Nitrospinota bacterium]
MNPNLINITGLLAATLTTISFLPQVIKILKTRHTKDISLLMYIGFTTGVLLWLIYGILLKELPIIIGNGITLIFVIIMLIFKIRYK